MANKKKPQKIRQTAPKISSEMLARQTEAFLRAGGKIEVVKQGVSGQYIGPSRRHITLGNGNKPSET